MPQCRTNCLLSRGKLHPSLSLVLLILMKGDKKKKTIKSLPTAVCSVAFFLALIARYTILVATHTSVTLCQPGSEPQLFGCQALVLVVLPALHLLYPTTLLIVIRFTQDVSAAALCTIKMCQMCDRCPSYVFFLSLL